MPNYRETVDLEGGRNDEEKVIWDSWTGCLFWTYWTITSLRIDYSGWSLYSFPLCCCCKYANNTMALNRIVDIQYEQSCLQLLCFGRGTVRIFAADASDPTLEITSWGMYNVYKQLKNVISKSKQRAPAFYEVEG